LYDPGTRAPTELVATDGGSVAWRKPLSTIFPESGYSTDNGWNFDRIPAAGLFVGTVFGTPESTSPSGNVVDLSKVATAGFRIANGSVVWRNEGSAYDCGPLPCDGTNQPLGLSAYKPPIIGLRLRMTGTATSSTIGQQTLTQGADIKLERFNLATGQTMWSVDAGANAALGGGNSPPLLGAEVVVLLGAGGKLDAIDLTTGDRSRIPAGSVAFCQMSTTYTGPAYRTGPGTTGDTYVGAAAEFPCSPNGTAVPVPSRLPGFVGPSLGGLVAFSEADAVVAAAHAG
jgi:hypothetical protein